MSAVLDKRPVKPEFTFVESILGIAAIRDYTKYRRAKGMAEDAVVAYFYEHLVEATREAAEQDPEGFDEASAVAAIPDRLHQDLRGGGYR